MHSCYYLISYKKSLLKKILLYILVISFLASCSTSNEVVSNKLFQKRKYQKGWYVNTTKTIDKKKNKSQPSFVSEDNKVAVIQNNVQREQEEQKFEVLKKIKIQESLEINKIYRTQEKKNLTVESQNRFALENNDFEVKVQTYTIKGQENNSIDRSDNVTRILLKLLGVGLIFYFSLAPLAILIALGRIESLTTNLIIWLIGIMILSISLYMAFVLATVFTPTIIVMLILGGAFIVVADIHALYLIFRGY